MHKPSAEGTSCDEYVEAGEDYNQYMGYTDKIICPYLELTSLQSCIILSSCGSKTEHSFTWLWFGFCK
jgi:hypothetical protein